MIKPVTHDPGARAGRPARTPGPGDTRAAYPAACPLTPGQTEKSIALQWFLTAQPGWSASVSLDPAARAAQHRIVNNRAAGPDSLVVCRWSQVPGLVSGLDTRAGHPGRVSLA